MNREVRISFTDEPPSRWKDALRFYGNTRSKPQGGWISAQAKGRVEKDRIELSTGEGDDNIVEGGCSGSLVWDQIHGRCVGMVDARLGRHTAYMIPVDCLVAACVEIRPEPPENQSQTQQIHDAIMLIDRRDERIRMEQFLRELREESPVKPVLCVISRRLDTHPDDLLSCFLNVSFPTALPPDQGYVNEAKEIELEYELVAMQRALAAIVCDDPDTTSPSEIAEQMRHRKETMVFTSELYLEDLNEERKGFLCDYVRFLGDIAKEQPNVPFFHCFCLTTNAPKLNAAKVKSAIAVFEKCLRSDGGNLHGPLIFGPLKRIQRRHLRDWIKKELKPLLGHNPRFDAKTLESYMLKTTC